MGSHDNSRSIIASTAAESNVTEFALPDSSWDEGRLLDYMRKHDKALGGLDRKTLEHEFCFGAAAQLKYEQLGGKWTGWAKDQGYPLETFRRRRLLYVRAGSLQALDKYSSKMEAYYDLVIYRRPSPKDLDALDAKWVAKAGGDPSESAAATPSPERPRQTTISEADGDQAQTQGEEAEETLGGLTAPLDRPDDPTAAEILGRVGSLLLKAEEVGLDDPCLALLDEIATTIDRLRNGLGGKGVAA